MKRQASVRVLLHLNSLRYLRFVDGVIEQLLERGAHVHVLVERPERTRSHEAWLETISMHERFSFGSTSALRDDRWWKIATNLRRAIDGLRFAGPAFAHSDYLQSRGRRDQPPWCRRMRRLPGLRGESGRARLERWLTSLDRAIPVSAGVTAEILAVRPDVVVSLPHLMVGIRSGDWVRAARALHIPTVMCVASWDNLSSKQHLHEAPDRLVVWNETQLQEAVRLHGVPADRIVVTGAQSFDALFHRRPTPREQFCQRAGLDPERPYILYLGGAQFPAELTEAAWARRWAAAVRGHPSLAGVGLLFRPHPNRVHEWSAVSFDDLDAVVWPRENREMPVAPDARQDFFDSIHHSAAVAGLNTTALIESAVVGRLVHVVLVDEFSTSQMKLPHFRYLLDVAGGLVIVASSLEQHLAQLAAALEAGPRAGAERAQPFLRAFVRPHGLEQDASPLLADAIVEGAGLAVASVPPSPLALRLFLLGWLYLFRARWKILIRFGRAGRDEDSE